MEFGRTVRFTGMLDIKELGGNAGKGKFDFVRGELEPRCLRVFPQTSPVIGVSPCKENHMKRTFEFAASAKTEAPLQKVITFLYQRTSSSRRSRPRESSPDCCSLPPRGAEHLPSARGGPLSFALHPVCRRFLQRRHYVTEQKPRLHSSFGKLVVKATGPGFKNVQYVLDSSFSSHWRQQWGGGQGRRDCSRLLLIWGQLWHSVLFIHYFIEKMSVLWFGPSQDRFVLHSYTAPCILDTPEDNVCYLTPSPVIYVPFWGRITAVGVFLVWNTTIYSKALYN